MSFIIGLDIGGTKIAGALFDTDRRKVAQIVRSTPEDYSDLITMCGDIVNQLEKQGSHASSIGVGVPGTVDQETGSIPVATNTPCLSGKPLREDLRRILNRPVALANDANCAALSEAVGGAGAGYRIVFGLILGTGVGGGLIVDQKIVAGPNGLTGEFGHIPLPFRETEDGPLTECLCCQKGCIDKSISGPALVRLYAAMTGAQNDATQIAERARGGDKEAQRVLDRFYTVVAKAMVPVIHMFDPDIIVVSGGLSNLPGLYNEVPKRWEKYTISKNLRTKFIPAQHGALSGLRGAAWMGRSLI